MIVYTFSRSGMSSIITFNPLSVQTRVTSPKVVSTGVKLCWRCYVLSAVQTPHFKTSNWYVFCNTNDSWTGVHIYYQWVSTIKSLTWIYRVIFSKQPHLVDPLIQYSNNNATGSIFGLCLIHCVLTGHILNDIKGFFCHYCQTTESWGKDL